MLLINLRFVKAVLHSCNNKLFFFKAVLSSFCPLNRSSKLNQIKLMFVYSCIPYENLTLEGFLTFTMLLI